MKRLRSAGKASIAVLAALAATLAALIGPDLLLGPMRADPSNIYDIESWIAVLAIGFVVLLMPSRRARVAAIVLIVLSQFIWLGSHRYFGSPLRHDQILLFFSEMRDTGAGFLSEWRVLAPAGLASLGAGTLLYWLHGRAGGLRLPRLRGAGLVLVIGLLFAAGRWGLWHNLVVNFSGDRSASVIGPFHAAVTAARFAFAPPPAPPPGVVSTPAAWRVLAPASEPVTVLMVMGESINPRHLSLMGYAQPTTPNLVAWQSSAPGGMVMSARYGFSAGVATLASVPSFVRSAAVPIGSTANGVNLFELAKASGFKSWFLSAQNRHFLDTAGGAPGAARVETLDEHEATYERVHDDYLIDYVRDATLDPATREFIFVHQRVNHVQYEKNCSHLSAFAGSDKVPSGPKAERRITNYDAGLTCWDRNVAALVEQVAKRPGAVYVFVTADHNELMGEQGLWGHLHPVLENALVPYILLTNRPDSDVARAFAEMPVPSFFHLSRSVARALDVDLEAPGLARDTFFVNRTLPFGLAGYMQIKQLHPGEFEVRQFDSSGRGHGEQTVRFDDVALSDSRVRAQLSRTTAGMR